MALPADWDTVRVYGTYVDVDGNAPPNGSVTFTATTRLRSASTHTAIVPSSWMVPLDSSGYLAIQLPVTDDPDIAPSGWAWTVTERFGEYSRSYTMLAPGGVDIDLTNVAPAIPPGEAPVQLILTVAGHGPGAEGDIPIALNDLSDATITTPTSGQILEWNGTAWVNSPLPAIAVTDFLGAVASQTVMLALVGQKGDWATRTDTGTDWQIIGDDPTQLSAWREMTYPPSPVTSVFGRVGVITGSKTDVGLSNVDNVSDVNKPVSTAQAAALALDLKAASNLSDLANAGTARTNLGLGGAAVLAVGTAAGTVAAGNDTRLSGNVRTANNLSDVASAATSRTNLGLAVGTTTGTVAAGDDARLSGNVRTANNLSDVASAATSRTNLGLGGAALLAVGTTAGTVAAGDDTRLTRRIIARALRTTISSGSTSTAAVGVLRLDSIAVLSGQSYTIKVPMVHCTSSVTTDNIRVEIRYSTSGAATTSSSVLPGALAFQNFGSAATIECEYIPGSNQTLSLLLCVARDSGTGTVTVYADGTRNAELKVIWNGTDVGNTGVIV